MLVIQSVLAVEKREESVNVGFGTGMLQSPEAQFLVHDRGDETAYGVGLSVSAAGSCGSSGRYDNPTP